ncbi:MAG: ATP-binding cassette domain-containing protein [Chlorobi bacterium]|nr:ATP-binding cassette domain-containing protein [Chlorobiota bacterium]
MIKINNLHKSFGEFKVLNGVDLTVEENKILTIIGKSGTGKSVLLKNIIGLLEPDSGTIEIDGIDATGFNEEEFNKLIRPKMALVFQESALWDSMTVAANIDLALQIQKHLGEAERKKRIKESLESVGLKDIENVYPDELSGGMLKRAAIARAIAMRPKYLLYDEPTTGLDPVLSNVINNLIKKINVEMGITSLIISHDIQGVEKISDYTAMLFEGKIIVTCGAKKMWEQKNQIFNDFIRGKIT